MKIANRSVSLFRAHIDPMIGPKSRNAFMLKDLGAKAYINEKETAVVVLMPDGSEHVVPLTNIQSIRLEPLPPAPVPLNNKGKGKMAILGDAI